MALSGSSPQQVTLRIDERWGLTLIGSETSGGGDVACIYDCCSVAEWANVFAPLGDEGHDWIYDPER